jgi:AraC family transcriptional regulator
MTWAIFTVDDCEMQVMWRRIYTEWLPTSGYNLVGDINFEMYCGKADHPRGEIWIPVEAQ